MLTTWHYPQKVGTNFAESGGRSVGIVRLRTEDMYFFLRCIRYIQIVALEGICSESS
jgi:hypothetical protein